MPGTTLRLRVLSGPETADLEPPAAGGIIGRSATSDMVLPDKTATVSRRHARLERTGGLSGDWVVTDLGSRHGTFLNAVPLSEGAPTPLTAGDRLRIGPWEFRVEGPRGETRHPTTTMASMEDGPGAAVTVVPEARLGSLADTQLHELMALSRALQNAASEEDVARIASRALLSGVGLERAALVRPGASAEQVEVLGFASVDPDETGPGRVSRSVLRAAAAGEAVHLDEQHDLAQAASVMTMGVSRAVCAPIRVADAIVAFAYADARSSGGWRGEETTFCAAVADLAGLAMANLRRSALEVRQAKLLRDLSVARDVQSRLTPAGSGTVGGLRYAAHTSAGRHVAGDFFSMTPLDDRRTAVLLGDVSGKGLGAGLLMAIVQSHLEALLLSGAPLGQAVTRLNQYLSTKSSANEFVTMLALVIDHASGEAQCVDAGHGLGFLCDAHDCWTAIDVRGGIPVGALPESVYQHEELPLPKHGRVVLLSDGVQEQTNDLGEEFGMNRTLAALRRSDSCEADVREVLNALVAFAGGRRFDDDVTIAAVETHATRDR